METSQSLSSLQNNKQLIDEKEKEFSFSLPNNKQVFDEKGPSLSFQNYKNDYFQSLKEKERILSVPNDKQVIDEKGCYFQSLKEKERILSVPNDKQVIDEKGCFHSLSNEKQEKDENDKEKRRKYHQTFRKKQKIYLRELERRVDCLLENNNSLELEYKQLKAEQSKLKTQIDTIGTFVDEKMNAHLIVGLKKTKT